MANELRKGTKISVIVDDELKQGEVLVAHRDGTFSVELDGEEEIYKFNTADMENIDPPESDDDEDSITITQTIKVSKSDVTIDSRTMSDPRLLEKEEAKQLELAKLRRKTRLAKLKADPRTPIQVRKAVLAARIRKIKARKPHTYRKEQVIAWVKEYELIKNRPESWRPGCIRAKKAKTAQDFIDELQIDDD